MPLSVRSAPHIIPKYTLTGDILAYLTCGLQYRYHNRGALPPTPGQRWFGQFIHAVMEEAFLQWKSSDPNPLPWKWNPDIRKIELDVARRLGVQGLYPPHNLFDRRKEGQKQLASRRAEAAINIWGQWLFPLVDGAEVRLQGIRPMPEGLNRAKYYEISGVVDVMTSVKLDAESSQNLLIRHLRKNDDIRSLLDRRTPETFEVIVDYKGMRRPDKVVTNKRSPRFGNASRDWIAHESQVLTYAWIRSLQADAAPVVAGVLLYLNELVPSGEDIGYLKDDIAMEATDVPVTDSDLAEIVKWQESKLDRPPEILKTRSIRVIPVKEKDIGKKLGGFDKVVRLIENSLDKELRGGCITKSWEAYPQMRTCTDCDFRYYCPKSAKRGLPTVP